MKRGNVTIIGWRGVILALAVIMAGLSEPVQCQIPSVAVLLQQSPVQGGITTPEPGVHHFTINTKLVLTAVPKPGYQFMCWLGDVSDSTSNHTVVYLNAPKIIIAVFERVEYEHLFAGEGIPVGGFSDGGTIGGAFTGGAAGPAWDEGDVEEPESPPQHKENPIPEPATILLLGLSSVMMRRRY